MCFFVITSCAALRQPGGASATTFGQDLHPRSLGHPQGVSTLHRGGVSGGPSDQKRTRQQIIRELSPGVVFLNCMTFCFCCSFACWMSLAAMCAVPAHSLVPAVLHSYIFLFLLRRTPLRNRLKWRISCTAKWSRSHGAFCEAGQDGL